ncbi:MAG: dihydroneopterin aldolase [Nitrospiraceae bacterium]|nr:dihydroneopterin aldolase [Nitrospiraceae bacterium]
MDRIIISDLAARCIIGVYEEERKEKQDVVITLILSAELAKAGKSDDIADTVDYRGVKKRVLSLVEGSSYRLVEALAEAVAAVCLAERGVKEATVRVEKPGALRFARTVAVEITRRGTAGA